MKLMNILDLTEAVGKKKDGWIAMTSDNKRVIGHAKSLKEVLTKARNANVKDPTVFKIGPFGVSFVG